MQWGSVQYSAQKSGFHKNLDSKKSRFHQPTDKYRARVERADPCAPQCKRRGPPGEAEEGILDVCIGVREGTRDPNRAARQGGPPRA